MDGISSSGIVDGSVVDKSAEGEVMELTLEQIRVACKNADWPQVLLNGGPPCFHMEGTKFCLRAHAWPGHETFHKFTTLDEALATVLDLAEQALLMKAALSPELAEMFANDGTLNPEARLRQYAKAARGDK